MKLEDKNLQDLRDGTYYCCANCREWFGRREPWPERECPDCGRLWKNARGVIRKKKEIIKIPQSLTQVIGLRTESALSVSDEDSDGCTPAIILALFLIAPCLVLILGPKVEKGWSKVQLSGANFVEGVNRRLEYIGGLVLSFASLSAATLLFFALLAGFSFLFLFVVAKLSGGRSPSEQASESLVEHGFLVGTIINLISNLSALWIVCLLFQREPDYLDFGLQFIIAVIIEYILFRLFWDKREM